MLTGRGPRHALGSVCLLMAVAGGACEPASPAAGLIAEARLGIFYGGQVQERQELPRVFEAARQTQGFRLVFRRPLTADLKVRWQIEQPGASRALHVTRLGEAVVHRGQSKLDQRLNFEAGDPVGLWNIRVLAGDELVIDRPWLVYDPVSRRRATKTEAP